jgi:RHS repeat-associated protein
MMQLSSGNGNTCLVYNYFSSWTPPTSCPAPSSVPTSGSGNNGNVMGYWDSDSTPGAFSHTASYTYDTLNRLGTATAKSLAGTTLWSQTYTYDRWGNGTCSGTGLCPSLGYNTTNNNQLATIGSSSFSYDAAGNMTTDPSNATAHTYQWDAEGRVSSVDNGSTWGFTYNAVGDRVQWAYTGGADQHLFDPAGGWLGVAGAYSIVRRGDGYLALYTSSETYFHHTNNLGTTSVMTYQGGTAVEDMVFYPWGNVWQSYGSGGYNFAEMPYYDTKTYTSPTMNRFYSMNVGRWHSPDPLGGDITNPQSLNRYAYVMNNQTSSIDPLGLGTCTPATLFLTCFPEEATQSNIQGPVWSLYNGYGIANPNEFGLLDMATTAQYYNVTYEWHQPEEVSSTINGASGFGQYIPGYWLLTDVTPVAAMGAVGVLGLELGPADIALIAGTGAVILASKNKDAINKVMQQIPVALLHIGKLNNAPDQDPYDRNGWRRSIRAAVKRGRLWTDRMSPGMWKNAMNALLDQVEWAVPQD